jgi:murein DD-endopeptidase MepM/ murein hydrolase activator NlpD
MNLKWTKKKLTLVIIPDVNRSVVSLSIPTIFAYAAAAGLVALILVFFTTTYLHMHSISSAAVLKDKLAVVDSEWQQTVSGKEQAIQQLQNEVIQLSKQADQMKTKVAEMKKLESDIKSITGIGPVAQGTKKAEPNTDASALPAYGKGGPVIPATQGEILKFGDQTQADMTVLGQEIETLLSNFTETKQKVEEKQFLLRGTPTIWPTTSKLITSSYGYRTDPFTRSASFHDGIDIGAAENEPIYAAADGKVTSTGFDHARGNNIVIEHSGGLRSIYMHLNKITVSEGNSVTKGQTIGLLGSTGRSTGPHLHYQLERNGATIDPEPYLQTARKDDK